MATKIVLSCYSMSCTILSLLLLVTREVGGYQYFHLKVRKKSHLAPGPDLQLSPECVQNFSS